MDVIVNRGKVVSLDSLPDFSIALDGFVSSPQVDPEHHRFSFDHHAGCLRFCTLSTCMQVWTAIQLGLDDLDSYKVYANDVDVDVCASVWCLQNAERCSEPQVKKLIDAINLGDAHMGAISINGMEKVVEWISSPEVESKKNNDYDKLSDNGLSSIMEAVLHRINMYVNNELNEVIKPHKTGCYKINKEVNDFVVVESSDTHIYSHLYKLGFSKILRYCELTDKSLSVTITKKSDFVNGFNLMKILEDLSTKESGWGGNSTIIGAPRNHDGSRSKLSLEEIISIVERQIT